MKPIINLSVLCALLLACLPAKAQMVERPEVRQFRESAGERSVLYRGREAPRYNFRANGHPYWSSPEFKQGGILFEGNFYDNLPVNIDAAAQLVLVRLASGQASVALSPAQVDTLRIGDRCFIGRAQGDRQLPAGFYQVLGDGPEQVYKRVDKRLHSAVNNVNGAIIGYNDPDYDSSLTRHFAIETLYYFRDREGRFSRFKGKSALLRKFPANKREIRAALREAGLDGNGTDFDTYCLGVLKAAAR
jgi:hypothetical protein